ncbi:hypothetical protein DFH11DRAFT_1690360 [Phellopilus nigrolimitatus]|nr:hypothetical protein DFH11DRAFT_1690360 [Phellopilus nigrolimitatus]
MALDLSSNAATKLEPFLLMSKSAKGAAAAKLIQDATSSHGTFVFSELLEMPNIQELSKTEHAPYHSLLQLFAFGTIEDYNNSRDTLPPLNQAQLRKLRLLTIISFALERRILPYPLLLQTLQIPTIRELEDLIIDGIYLDLMRGKLDQKEQRFEVEYAIGRDFGPGKVESLLNSLQEWANTTSSVLATLDAQLASLASQTTANALSHEEHERAVEATLADVYEKHKDGNKGRGGPKYGGSYGNFSDRDDPMAMDVDDPRGSILLSGLPSSVDATKGRKFKSMEHPKSTSRKRNRF